MAEDDPPKGAAKQAGAGRMSDLAKVTAPPGVGNRACVCGEKLVDGRRVERYIRRDVESRFQ